MPCNHDEVKLGGMIVGGVLEFELICRLCGQQRKINERTPGSGEIRYATQAERAEIFAKYGVR